MSPADVGKADQGSSRSAPHTLTARRIWAGYGVAVVSTSTAVLVRVALTPWTQDRPVMSLFIIPIILSAYLGGLWPGILATLIAALGVKIFMFPPAYSLRFEHALDVVQWCLLLGNGILVSVLSEALHRSRRRMAEAADQARRAREATERQERRFQAMVERGHECVVLIDADMRLKYVSPSVLNVEGYTPEELVGHTRLEHTHPDDQLYLQGIHEQVTANPGVPFVVTWRRRHKDGRWMWMEGLAANLLAVPEVAAVVVNYRDVTGRKHDEDRIRAQLAHLDLLHQITRNIGSRQDLPSILQLLAAQLETQLPVDFSCICLYDRAADAMKVAHLGEKSGEKGLADGQWIPLEGLSLCMRGVLVYEPDTTRRDFELHRRLTAASLHSVVIAPLQVDAIVLGMLVVARRHPNGFAAAECDFLTQLSDHVALAARQSQQYDTLRQAYQNLHPEGCL